MDNLITVSHSEVEYMCNIEGMGVLPPKDVLLKAIDLLDAKFTVFQMEMFNLKNK